MGAGLVLVLAGVIVAVFLLVTIKRMLYVVPPNQALILSGGKRRSGNRTYGYRVVCGGRALRIPLLEHVDVIDLRNINIPVEVKGAFSKGGIPLNVQAVANVKLPGEEPLINNAVERFLGRTREEIVYISKETLEGNLRGVLAQLTPEEVNEDKNRFTQILTEEAEHDLAKLGIKLDQLKIQNVTDDVGYLSSIGRIRGAELRRVAVTAEARAQSQAAANKALNWQASEVARYEADLSIAEKEMTRRIVDAKTRGQALIAAAQGEVHAQIAKIRAEVKRQQARAVQVQRMLEADVVQPADAERLRKEEEARGQAAIIVERGKAEAQALRELVAAYRKSGVAGREVLALQSLLPLLGDISGARFPLNIRKITVLPHDNSSSGNDSITRRLIATNEQLKAATGIDLGAVASRLGGSSKASPSTSKS